MEYTGVIGILYRVYIRLYTDLGIMGKIARSWILYCSLSIESKRTMYLTPNPSHNDLVDPLDSASHPMQIA